MMNIQDILARILNPGAQNQLAAAGQQQPANALTAPFQAASQFGVSDANSLPRMPQQMQQPAMQPQMPAAGQQAPVSAFQPQQTPQGAPMPQGAPAPRQGGGIGDFLGGLIAPKRAAKNQTVQYLTRQGLDEGTATLLAGNKQALQQYLLQQSRGADPMDALKLEKTQLEIDQMRSPTTDDIREYQFAKGQGYQGTFNDFMLEGKKAGATNVVQNVGEGDKFYEELDKSNAAMFSELQQGGITAGQNIVRLDRLGGLLEKVPTGATAAFKQIAGNYGINTEGLDDIQAAQALINQMVPEQRPAGSGPMSDADLELFKQSVPRLINQPGGNKIILDTMKGIAQYTKQQGDIANMVANREISPAQGRKMLSELQNPLEGFGKGGGSNLPEGVSEEDLEFTMKKHGLSREEVLERLNAR